MLVWSAYVVSKFLGSINDTTRIFPRNVHDGGLILARRTVGQTVERTGAERTGELEFCVGEELPMYIAW